MNKALLLGAVMCAQAGTVACKGGNTSTPDTDAQAITTESQAASTVNPDTDGPCTWLADGDTLYILKDGTPIDADSILCMATAAETGWQQS